ncbi:hypothetical protein HGM15179_000460 [Zosterops borbonicus]|uniref:Uncharacterized protein n=1 Tax=Zosterops borbonicus TaxID=364589 RepID=A0A8K1LUF4_9PASS|nr:hypothetical protein HGM15179_000460 [Zosterops borbonicus]
MGNQEKTCTPTMVELGATWAKQEQERAHGVKRVFHQALAPQDMIQRVPNTSFSWGQCCECAEAADSPEVMVNGNIVKTVNIIHKLLRPQWILILKKDTISHQG